MEPEKIDIDHFIYKAEENRYMDCCSVAQSCPTLCNPMGCSTPGLPVLHHLPWLAQTHVHQVTHAIQPSHPLSQSKRLVLCHIYEYPGEEGRMEWIARLGLTHIQYWYYVQSRWITNSTYCVAQRTLLGASHDLNRKEIQKTGGMCVHSTDSLCSMQKLTQHYKATTQQ